MDPEPNTTQSGDPDNPDGEYPVGYRRIFLAKIPANKQSVWVKVKFTASALAASAAALENKWLEVALTPYGVARKTQNNTPAQWEYVVDLAGRQDRGTVAYIGTGPVHATLLPTGKVLYWGQENPSNIRLFDPVTGRNARAGSSPNYHLFCAGHTLMADGSVFVAGGNIGAPAGLRTSTIYSPRDNFWTRLPLMDQGRWYPSCTALETGEILVLSGSYATGLVLPQGYPGDFNQLPQVWEPANGRFRNLTSATKRLPYYPMVFAVPDGRVLYTGPTLTPHWIVYPLEPYQNPLVPDQDETARTTKHLSTVNAGSWETTSVANATRVDLNNFHGHYASAVMYQKSLSEPGKVQILVIGGTHPGDPSVPQDPDTVATVEKIELPAADPMIPSHWTTSPTMNLNHKRQVHTATLLADGTVLVTGGSSDPERTQSSAYAVTTAELYDPAQNTWTDVAVFPEFRGYHSVALLLPDGRVWSAGQNSVSDEIYSPPYLFKGPRPVIQSAPATITYGQTFPIQTTGAGTNPKITLLGLGSVTHFFNMNQRFLKLVFTGQSATAPANARLCPPGYYMLFVINDAGVPSVAKIIQVLPQNPPEIVMVCPANGGIVPPGNIKVSAKVRNPAAVQRVDFYSGVEPIAQVPASQASDGHYSTTWIQQNPYTYILLATAVMTDNSHVDSDPITVQVASLPAQPTLTVQPPPGGVGGGAHYAFPVRVSVQPNSPVDLLEVYAERPTAPHLNWTVLVTNTTGSPISQYPYTWPRARSGANWLSTVVRNGAGLEREDLESVTQHTYSLFGGGLDTTFRPKSDTPNLDINNTVRALAIQSDGKILIGGDFTTVDGTGRNRIARLNPDGSLDTTFDPGIGATSGSVHSIAVQPNNQVLIGGGFTRVDGTVRLGIARLHANGSHDLTFNPSGGVSGGDVYSVAVQTVGSEAKILIGGGFTSMLDGTPRNGIARLNADGSLDTGFNPGVSGGASPVVNSIAVQAADGKVLIGGDFTTVAGQSRNRVARLTAGGGLDSTFDPGTGPNGPVRSLALQKDGKVVIGGEFTAVGSDNRNRIARLNVGGSLDNGFQNGLSGANGSVYSVAVESEGKVVVGGAFTSVNGTTRNRIGRLNDDGNLDDTFRPGPTGQLSQYGPDNVVRSVAIQADGLIVVGGEFEAYSVPGSSNPLSADARVARIGGL